MLPSQFWEEEPADVLLFIEQANRQKQRDNYNGALMNAHLFGITLYNSFRGKGEKAEKYPTFEEWFEIDEHGEKIDPLQKRIAEIRAQFGWRLRGNENGTDR